MRQLTAADGTRWHVYGLTFIPSDSMYQTLQKAINGEIELTQQSLQGATGHRAPIIIDHEKHTINFQRF